MVQPCQRTFVAATSDAADTGGGSGSAATPRPSQANGRNDLKPLPYSFWLGTFIWRGSVLPRILGDVFLFGLLSILIVIVMQWLQQRHDIDVSVASGPFQAAGAVLGLLLVLRVNAGYNRWWEARVLWGGIVNQSRNLAILGLTLGLGDPRWRSQFIKYVASFPHVTRRSLRNQRVLPELERLLDDNQRREIVDSIHMPGEVSSRLSELLCEARRGGMDGFAYSRAEEQRARLVDHLGGCERIRATPLARSSAILVRQFIFLYLLALPASMIDMFDETGIDSFFSTDLSLSQIWLVPPLVMLIAFMLLSLDRIGMELQNPFDTQRIDFLPLDTLCTMIERNVLELLHRYPHPDVTAPVPENVELPPDAMHPNPDDFQSFDVS